MKSLTITSANFGSPIRTTCHFDYVNKTWNAGVYLETEPVDVFIVPSLDDCFIQVIDSLKQFGKITDISGDNCHLYKSIFRSHVDAMRKKPKSNMFA